MRNRNNFSPLDLILWVVFGLAAFSMAAHTKAEVVVSGWPLVPQPWYSHTVHDPADVDVSEVDTLVWRDEYFSSVYYHSCDEAIKGNNPYIDGSDVMCLAYWWGGPQGCEVDFDNNSGQCQGWWFREGYNRWTSEPTGGPGRWEMNGAVYWMKPQRAGMSCRVGSADDGTFVVVAGWHAPQAQQATAVFDSVNLVCDGGMGCWTQEPNAHSRDGIADGAKALDCEYNPITEYNSCSTVVTDGDLAPGEGISSYVGRSVSYKVIGTGGVVRKHDCVTYQ